MKAPRLPGPPRLSDAASRPTLQTVSRTGVEASRRTALLLGAAAMLGADPRAAWAGYGPAGGAIRSNLPLQEFELDEWLDLSPRKLKQRAESISLDRSRDLVKQIAAELEVSRENLEALNALIAKLQEEAPDASLTEELTAAQSERESAERERELAQQLEERVVLLERLEQQPNWVVYGAAVCAAFGSTLAMHPVDTYKTMMMSQSGEGEGADDARPSGGGGSSSTGGALGDAQHGVGAHADALPVIAKLPLLYKGITANLLKEVPPSALYLGVYEAVKTSLLTTSWASMPLLVYLVAGGCGEFVGSILRAPSEAIKSRVQSGQAESTAQAFEQLTSDDTQRRSLASTWATSLARDVPFGAMQIAIFEVAKTMIVQNPDIRVDPNTLAAEITLGAFGGLIGSLLTAPMDVVITRMITQPSGAAPENNPFKMAKRIFEEDGPKGFLNGAGARGFYWTPAIGIFLGLYCSLRKYALDIM